RGVLLSKIIYSDIQDVLPKKDVFFIKSGLKDLLTNKDFKKIIKNRMKKKIPNFLFLSNMIESKGPLEVLKICNHLKKKGINFKCNFAGNFQDPDFKNKFLKTLEELNLKKSCTYLGPIFGNEKKKLLSKTTHLIFPTKYPEETYPAVILEAFMFGIPVFSYNAGAIKEMISIKEVGFVSNACDWKALGNAIEKRLKKKTNPNLIRDYFQLNYSYEQTTKSMKKIWSKMINKK
ncbi:MAG: glycosyltransferase family 4 protein, partial [Promethearchaeota archaeon]